MANNNFREHVTATLIDQIQAGSAPWQKPWEAGQFRVPAFNPANGKPFRGINQLWLEAQGHTDPRWVTFRQVQANGYQVRKGEKGTRIECWQWYDREPMKNDAGGPILDDTGKQRYREVRLQRPKLFHAVVFNGSQIDGLELFVRQEPDFNPIERAKQALEQLHVPVVNEVRFSGLYQPTKDEIRMPPIASFDGLSKYYATALQEGAHATGHYSRLARNMGPVGSEDYARETLRTAVAGYMLNTELGLGNYPEQDSSYAGRWISVIKDDPNALFQAARDAEVAKTWIMEPDKRPALIPSAVRGQSMSQVQAKGQSVPMEPAEAQRAERQALVNNMFVNHPHAHPTLWAMDLQESLVLGGSRENKEQLSAAEIREGLLASDLSNDNLRRYLGQTAEAANWRSFASIVPGYDEEHHEFAQIAEQFGKIDWVAEYAASRERREKGIAHRDETLAALGGQAASPLHRELLSALWDLDGPGNKPYAQRPEWYVAGDQRQDDVLKLLSKPLETNVQAPELSMAVFRSEEPAELVVPVPNLKYRDVQSKWMVHASRMAGFAEPEAQEMGMAASAFNGIDAWTHYIDNQDDRREIVQRNKATEKELEALAGRSAKHAELLSVLVDTHEPQAGELFIDTDKWYVPAEKRTNAIAKEIGINPAEYIAEKLMAANQKARAEQNARPLEVAEIRKSWLEVAAREAGISYPSFSAYQQKEYSETDWYKEGATEAAAFYIRDSVDNQSLAHRELASVLWDTYAPRKVDRPAFYISAESRKNDFLRALGSDPEKALLLKAAQQRPNQIDLKEIFKPLVEISEKEIKANWLHQVAQSEGMADANELREAYHKFHGVDAWTHYIDNQDTRREIVERNKATEKELEALAGRSVKHAELLSVLVDSRERQAGEFFIDTSKWYVPADLRKHEVVKSLGKDPEGSLLGLVAKSHEEKKVMPGKTLERDPENKRIFLTVPFSENKEAKALGAKWDRRDKVWFVNEGADMKPFAKWQKKVETARKENPEDLARKEFAEACEENGLVLKGLPEMDGNWHRVAVDGDAKGKTSGSYRGFLEGIPAGQIMNFKTASEPVKWVATGVKVDAAELERIKAASAAKKAEDEQKLRFQYRQVAKQAYAMFQNAIEATNDHPYLKRKQVTGETLRVDRQGNLLMPMTNEKGFIENVQTISPDGTKMYQKGGRKTGLMHIIPGKKNAPWIVAEGYSTGKSLNAATGYTTVVAMDGGNLAVVAETLRKQSPDRPLLIASDDDHKQVEKVGYNPGQKAAEKAAERSGAKILRPDLTEEDRLNGRSDFNDLHVARGFEQFRKDLRKQIAELGVAAGPKQGVSLTPQKKTATQSNQMTV